MPRNRSFGNPRNQQGAGGEDDPVNQLAALAHIFSSLQAPQQAAQEGQQARAMQMLGLMMQQGNQEAQLASQDKYHRGTLGIQEKELSMNQDKFNAQQSNEAAKIDLQAHGLQDEKAYRDKALLGQAFAHIAANPQMTPQMQLQYGAGLGIDKFPELYNQQRNAGFDEQANQIKGLFGGAYSQFEKNPRQAQSGVNALWQDPRMQNPEIQSRVMPQLDILNAALAHPQVAPLPQTGFSEVLPPPPSTAGVTESQSSPLNFFRWLFRANPNIGKFNPDATPQDFGYVN